MDNDQSQMVKPPNPDGRGGFGDNPQNINRNGRPKGLSWAQLLEEVGEEESPSSGTAFKEIVARRLYMLAMGGNIQAMKLIFDRTEGPPKQMILLERQEEISQWKEKIKNLMDEVIHAKEPEEEFS